MALLLYAVGFLVLIAGLALAATLLGVPGSWTAVGVLILAGIAVLSIAANVGQGPRSPPSQE